MKTILFLLLIGFSLGLNAQEESTKRARDLGIPFEGTTGMYNNITDVPGVEVGYTTLIKGEGADDNMMYECPEERLVKILEKYNRIEK